MQTSWPSLEVEDEDLTELDTFGGVLRSSIDDPVQAFLKAQSALEGQGRESKGLERMQS